MGAKWPYRLLLVWGFIIGHWQCVSNIFYFCVFFQLALLNLYSLRFWRQDYHKRATSDKSASIRLQVCPINFKVSIIKREPPLFSIEIFGRIKREKKDKPFNFIASRALKYSLRSTFHFQALCRKQESWHLCMLLLCTMLFSPQMCTVSHPSIPSHRSFWRTPSSGPVQNGVAMSECKLTVVLW